MIFYKHYLGDYAKSTNGLSTLEHGAYGLLMQHYYSTERALPPDFEFVCRIARARSDDERRAVEYVLSQFFEKTDEGWRNRRCDKEIESARRIIEQSRAASAKGVEARRQMARGQPNGQPSGQPHGVPSQSQSQRKDKPSPTTRPHSAEGFDDFWSAYPKKNAKLTAEEAWAKLNPGVELRGRIAKALAVQKASRRWTKDGGQFIPNAATWLNGKRWEDVLDSVQSDEGWLTPEVRAAIAAAQAKAMQ